MRSRPRLPLISFWNNIYIVYMLHRCEGIHLSDGSIVEKYSVSCVLMTKDGIGNYIVVQSWSLFHNFVLRWRCILSNIYKMVEPSTLFNRTNCIHMRTTVSRRLNILCIMFKIIAFFLIMLFALLYVRVGILLTCGKYLHVCIILLKREVWVLRTSLAPPFLLSQCQYQGGTLCLEVKYLCVRGHVYVC
jgi:hypothetical protein